MLRRVRAGVTAGLLALVVSPVVAGAQEKFLGRTADEWSAELTAAKSQRRVHAAWALAQLAGRSDDGPLDHEQFAELVKLISDGDPSIRYWGVVGLAAIAQRQEKGDGGRSAVANALLPLLEDKSPAPRIAAAEAMGHLGQADRALPVLVAAMNDPQESVRIQAVAALEKLGAAARPADSTLRAATSDSSEYVKRISIRALERLDRAK
jgi:HEAT repeat protein